MYRLSSRVYELFILQIGLILTSSPIIIPLLFLDKVIDNVLLWGFFLLFVGPSISAVIGALLTENHQEQAPFRLYFSKYVSNFLDALKITVPAVAVGVILVVDIAWQNKTAYNFVAWLFIIGLVFLSIFYLFATIINVKYKFRFKDLCKLTLYYMFAQYKISLKFLSYFVITFALMYFVSDFLVLLLTVVLLYLLVKDFMPILNDIRVNFIKKR